MTWMMSMDGVLDTADTIAELRAEEALVLSGDGVDRCELLVNEQTLVWTITCSGRFADGVADAQQREVLAYYEHIRERYPVSHGSVYLDLQAAPVVSFPPAVEVPFDPNWRPRRRADGPWKP